MQWRVKTIEKVTDEGEARKSESPTASARHHFRPHSKIQIFKHEIFMKEFFRTLNICQSLMNCFLAKKNFALIFFFFLFSINYNTSIRRSTEEWKRVSHFIIQIMESLFVEWKTTNFWLCAPRLGSSKRHHHHHRGLLFILQSFSSVSSPSTKEVKKEENAEQIARKIVSTEIVK